MNDNDTTTIGTIRAIVIEPMKKPEIRDIENTLQAKQAIVDGYIENVDIGPDVSCYCNEEGKLNGLKPNRGLRADGDERPTKNGELYEIICGTMLICGYDPDTGEDLSLTDEQTERYRTLFSDPEILCRTANGSICMLPIHVI